MNLATFVDRDTMVYEREYAHPIERVWEAVSTGEHLDAWLLPTSRVERRLGGACSFTWGSPEGEPGASEGTVTVWEPPTAVQYTFADGSWHRFDLIAVGAAATSLRFTLHFLPAPDAVDDDFAGGSYPVPGTAWQPGFLAGFHEMLDQRGGWLDGTWTLEANLAGLEAFLRDGPSAEHLRLIDVYDSHVRATCPPT